MGVSKSQGREYSAQTVGVLLNEDTHRKDCRFTEAATCKLPMIFVRGRTRSEGRGFALKALQPRLLLSRSKLLCTIHVLIYTCLTHVYIYIHIHTCMCVYMEFYQDASPVSSEFAGTGGCLLKSSKRHPQKLVHSEMSDLTSTGLVDLDMCCPA